MWTGVLQVHCAIQELHYREFEMSVDECVVGRVSLAGVCSPNLTSLH